MNTPAHAIINLAAIGRKKPTKYVAAIVIGALVPDAAMILFYFIEKVIFRIPEHQIWNQDYYNASWQIFFDLFNSLPLIALVFILAWLWQKEWIKLFSLSMSLHILLDLPFHHDDAHRHFFPFSDWRFESPISYWDPNHYGIAFSIIELCLVIIGSIILYRNFRARPSRLIVIAVLLSHFTLIGYVLVMWV